MEPIITVLDGDLVDISVKLADDCTFGFTLTRDELSGFIDELMKAYSMMQDE